MLKHIPYFSSLYQFYAIIWGIERLIIAKKPRYFIWKPVQMCFTCMYFETAWVWLLPTLSNKVIARIWIIHHTSSCWPLWYANFSEKQWFCFKWNYFLTEQNHASQKLWFKKSLTIYVRLMLKPLQGSQVLNFSSPLAATQNELIQKRSVLLSFNQFQQSLGTKSSHVCFFCWISMLSCWWLYIWIILYVY